MENPVLEPRSERIARYKAERRRELAERFGNAEELPAKWVRREEREARDHAPCLAGSAPPLADRASNGRAEPRRVSNGFEAEGESAYLRREYPSGSASVISSGGPVAGGPPGTSHAPQLRTRVSVGQLRSTLLQQSGSGTEPEEAGHDGSYAASSLDLAVAPGSEVGGRRRARRYLPGVSGGGRKTSERFRTQPVTASEMQETGGLLEEEEEENSKADVKTDDRAKMSVAAKMSLFKELEKTVGSEVVSSLLKPRSAHLPYERRTRRGGEHRSLTQPITCEEMVAISGPQPAPSVEAQVAQAEPAVTEAVDENCKLSVSEKLALFNKLSSQGDAPAAAAAAGPPERRRQGGRYRTQPITVEEVSLLQKGPAQLPPLRLSSPQLSDRQQAAPVNLRPNETRQSPPPQTRGGAAAEPDAGGALVDLRPPQTSGEIRGILRKSRSAAAAPEWSRDVAGGDGSGVRPESGPAPGQNGGEEEGWTAAPAPRRERRGVDGGGGAPWRQRGRSNRRETVAVAPLRTWAEPEEQTPPPRPAELDSSDVSREEEEEEEGGWRREVAGPRGGRAHACPTDQRGQSTEDNGISHDAFHPQCWGPVFSSVYPSSIPQYVMCYNQTSLSFEAQEVSSSNQSQAPPQPQWRQKVQQAEEEQPQPYLQPQPQPEPQVQSQVQSQVQPQPSAAEQTCSLLQSQDQVQTSELGASDNKAQFTVTGRMAKTGLASPEPVREATPPSLTSRPSTGTTEGEAGPQHTPPVESPEEARSVREATPLDEQETLGSVPVETRRAPPPTAAAADPEQDLSALCQTDTPMLTSAVAEHRRSVRPSRRTQGSRNPLRALAAREDVRQDYMGQRTSEDTDRTQAEKKVKNCSTAVISSTDAVNNNINLLLIHIKGRRHVQVRVVEPAVRSLNSGDCFLLVTDDHCILWIGEFSNASERAKATELAGSVVSQRDLGCRASQLVVLEEGVNADASQASDFWNLLGGRTQYRGAGAPEEDDLYESGVTESNCVYRLSENRLVPHEQAWASAPRVSLLESTEALVFDFGSEVYLWQGKAVAPGDRSVAQQLAQQVWGGSYDYRNCRVNPLDPGRCNASIQPCGERRPGWALFALFSEDSETALFREKFPDWAERRASREERAPLVEVTQSPPTQTPAVPVVTVVAAVTPQSGSLTPCDAKALLAGQGVAPPAGDGPLLLQGLDVRRGRGAVAPDDGQPGELSTIAVETWHVRRESEVRLERPGQLHEGDSYRVRWTYAIDSPAGVREGDAHFLWQGRHSSADGPAHISSHKGAQVLVPQGKEPPCFLQLFQGALVVHKGSREDPAPSSSSTANTGAWRLFCVRGELPEEASLLEVDCRCAGLRSRAALVLLNGQQGALYLWLGCKTPAGGGAREVGRRAVERLTKMCPPELGLSSERPVSVHEVEEGSEPAEFWNAIGQQDRKAYDCMLQDPGKYNFTPRLFRLSARSGAFEGEELTSSARLPGVATAMPFVQECLTSAPRPSLFLLDNRLEVYLWQRGRPEDADSSGPAGAIWDDERRCAMQTVLQYCKEMNPRRPPPAYLILDGSEPLTFTNVFPHWEKRPKTNPQGDTERVKLTLVQDALAQLTKTQYPLEELLRTPLPQGVDPQYLEVYLSDLDFQTILEMKRDEYNSLPNWKQVNLKKSKGLYN